MENLKRLEEMGCPGEALKSSAVSRAYYAAFRYARNHEEEYRGFHPTRTGTDHRKIREHLENQGDSELAAMLDELSKWRGICDYKDLIEEDLEAMVLAAIQDSRQIIDELQKREKR